MGKTVTADPKLANQTCHMSCDSACSVTWYGAHLFLNANQYLSDITQPDLICAIYNNLFRLEFLQNDVSQQMRSPIPIWSVRKQA